MSGVHTMPNSEAAGRKRKVKLILNMPDHASTSEMPSSPATPSLSDMSEDSIAEYFPDYMHKNHQPHSDCPDSLGCLPDTNGRPQHTLPVILRCAILGSSQKRLTIREIYAAMEAKYPYYKTAAPSWKQSIRHHLSLNRLFERQPRPATDPGYGSYWTVNLSATPGTKRPRKRGGTNKNLSNTSPVPLRKRGRPRKILPTIGVEVPQRFVLLNQDPPNSHVGSAICHVAETGCIQLGEAESIEDQPEPADDGVAYGLEDGYESEDQLPTHPMDRRASLVGLSSFGPSRSTPFKLPPSQDRSNKVIEQLQAELESLRQQSGEAVSLSLRLSEQLAQAQAESSSTRAILRTIEGLLEDERRRRREAERAVEIEEKGRRKAEEALDDLLSQSIVDDVI